MRKCLLGLLLVVAAAWNWEAFAGERRMALVIGNGAYTGAGRLANTTNDATAIAGVLDELGFEVTLVLDVDRRAAISAIDAFGQAVVGADIAFLFYAGHGMQIGGQNFMLPVDVDISSERALRYSAIDIGEVVAETERSARVALIVLDACRDNPYVDVVAQSMREERAARPLQGLSAMQLSGRGAIVAYAAAAGEVASDGGGKHSPYTEALLAEIGSPGVEVGLMFRRAAGRVCAATRGSQRPELLVRLVEEVYLNPAPMVANAVATAQLSADAPTPHRNKVGAADGSSPADGGGENGPSGMRAEPATQPAAETVDVAAASEAGNVAVRSTRREGFFGNRIVRKPVWADSVAVPSASTFRPSRPVPIAERDGNDSYGTAQDLPIDALVDARIAPRGDPDWYALELPIAGLLQVTAERPSGEINLFARVWDADRRVVRDWQSAERPGDEFAAAFALPAPGRYMVEIVDGDNNADSAESFSLAFAFEPSNDPLEPNDSIGAARPIPLPADFAPAIFPRGDRDWMSVWAPESGLLTLRAENVPKDLDVYMRLWDAAGNVVRDWQGPARAGGDVVLEAEVAVPGVYSVEMTDGNNDAESVVPFSFSARFEPVADAAEPNDSFGAAALVASTGAFQLAVFPRGDSDWLAIDVDHPGELSVHASDVPPEIDLHMRVWTADKAVLRDWIAPLRRGGDTEGFADLPSSGRYFVELADGNSDASSRALYDLDIAFTPQPDQYEPNDDIGAATPLTPGGEVLFNILPRGDHDWFHVEAPGQGELAVTIDEGPESLDLHYRVWNADRQVIRDWVAPYRKGGLTEGFADLPAAGPYFIEIVDGNNDERSIDHATLRTVFTATGDRFEPNGGFGSAAPLAAGHAAEATILPRGDADWFAIEAPRGGEVSVLVEDVPPDLDIHVRLWDAEGAASGWIGPPRQGGVTDARFPVKGPGLYRLEMVDGNNDQRSPLPFRFKVDFR